MIAIIDYGMGNLKNVYKALVSIDVEAVITSEPEVIKACDKVILPGVGAFKEAIATLHRTGLKEVIEKSVASGKPLLGICLGMQLVFETSYENGRYEGLGLLPGEIIKLDVPFKVPHMGWNRLEIVKEAIISANKNKEINRTKNIKFYTGDTKTILHQLHLQANKVIVDPPRSGLDQKTKEYLLKLTPEKLIYVSCNPVTLARDIKDLSEKYQFQTVTFVDMFPNTEHVESVCILKRR